MSTLVQIPRTAAAYYDTSFVPLWRYDAIGKDDAGRRVYQRYSGDAPYGYPVALLTYREFVADVRAALARAPQAMPIGIARWTRPYYRDGSPVGPLSMSEAA